MANDSRRAKRRDKLDKVVEEALLRAEFAPNGPLKVRRVGDRIIITKDDSQKQVN